MDKWNDCVKNNPHSISAAHDEWRTAVLEWIKECGYGPLATSFIFKEAVQRCGNLGDTLGDSGNHDEILEEVNRIIDLYVNIGCADMLDKA